MTLAITIKGMSNPLGLTTNLIYALKFMMDYYLGIDFGTSGARGIVINKEKETVRRDKKNVKNFVTFKLYLKNT